MAIHGDRQLNWLQRLLGADSLQQSYQQYQPGPVIPTLDVIGTGPVALLVHPHANYTTDAPLEWTNLDTGVVFEVLPKGFWYRLMWMTVTPIVGTTRIFVELPNTAAFQQRPILQVNPAAGQAWGNWLHVLGAATTSDAPAESLAEFSRHWLPGPLELHREITGGGNATIFAGMLQLPLGASCPP